MIADILQVQNFLSPYLTIANAALTYQPIGSYLAGLTVGSTAIGSGTKQEYFIIIQAY